MYLLEYMYAIAKIAKGISLGGWKVQTVQRVWNFIEDTEQRQIFVLNKNTEQKLHTTFLSEREQNFDTWVN